MKKIYITTPIYYINDKPHIGHAYSTIAADILARFYRERGYDTRFLTGTDENSQKTIEAAELAGKDPHLFADEMVIHWKDLWKQMNISNDDFIRTTEDRHTQKVLEMFEKINQKGDIQKKKYIGLYCNGCEAFKMSRELNENGECPDHLRKPDEIEEENYFFLLSRYQDRLLKFYEAHPDFVVPRFRYNEVKRFVESGLEDISISREGKEWGIPLPIDKNHVFYVWFDALINYLSGAEDFWPAEAHFIGKDIIRFHAVIWPAMLMSAGYSDDQLPRHIPTGGFFTTDGQKISKSLGNAVNPVDIIEQYGNDPLRYYLISEVKFGKDGDFSHQRFAQKYETDLGNTLGNLISRIINLAAKLPSPIKITSENNKEITELWKSFERDIREIRFHDALDRVWHYLHQLNQKVDQEKPWEFKKQENGEELLLGFVSEFLEVFRQLSLMLLPILPETAHRIAAQLGLELQDQMSEAEFVELKQWGNQELAPVKGAVLFPRIERE